MPKRSKQPKPLRHHPFVLPVVVFMLLFFIGMVGFIGAGGTTVGADDIQTVRLSIDGEETTLPTRAKSVGELLQRLEITLAAEDTVEPSLETPIEEDNFVVQVYKARPVLVVDGDVREVTYTADPTPDGVARAAGLEIHPEDKVQLSPVERIDATELVKQGVVAEQVTVDRATPANLNLYGTSVAVRTHAATVGELLIEKDIQLNQGDTFEPGAETPLTPNLEVFIVRLGKEVAQVEEAIEPPAEFVDDFNLTIGSSVTKDPGKPGKKLVTYEVEQENGVEISRRVLQEVIVEQPVKKIVARGRKAPVVVGDRAEIMAQAGISSSEYYAADFIISHESGWRVNAQNARGCAGLGQACPGSKLAAVCPNWQSDAVCQMRFFSNYARNRYGSWANAYNAWQRQRWW